MRKYAVAAALLAALFGSGQAAHAGVGTQQCLPAICHICVDQETTVYYVHYCVI